MNSRLLVIFRCLQWVEDTVTVGLKRSQVFITLYVTNAKESSMKVKYNDNCPTG